jgi:hypothetical protein
MRTHIGQDVNRFNEILQGKAARHLRHYVRSDRVHFPGSFDGSLPNVRVPIVDIPTFRHKISPKDDLIDLSEGIGNALSLLLNPQKYLFPLIRVILLDLWQATILFLH